MADSVHAAATHHLPAFITPPGQTDVLMVIMSIVLVLAVLGFGILFLRLHTLPERMAHRSQKLQFEIVAVLGLIALFTHMHIFWIAGLLLALIDFPDFGSMLGRMAQSLETIAGVKSPQSTADTPAAAALETHDSSRKDGKPAAMASETAQEKRKELGHA